MVFLLGVIVVAKKTKKSEKCLSCGGRGVMPDGPKCAECKGKGKV
jgi:DnaJ-class molecular chaperone